MAIFLKGKVDYILFCCPAEAKCSAKNLMGLVSYGKFGFSRTRTKAAKGKCLARKAEIEVLI